MLAKRRWIVCEIDLPSPLDAGGVLDIEAGIRLESSFEVAAAEGCRDDAADRHVHPGGRDLDDTGDGVRVFLMRHRWTHDLQHPPVVGHPWNPPLLIAVDELRVGLPTDVGQHDAVVGHRDRGGGNRGRRHRYVLSLPVPGAGAGAGSGAARHGPRDAVGRLRSPGPMPGGMLGSAQAAMPERGPSLMLARPRTSRRCGPTPARAGATRSA